MADDGVVRNAGVDPHGQKVRQEGQAEVFAIAVSEFENVSAISRLAFSWTIVPFDVGAAGTVLLVQCDSDTLVLHIQEVQFRTDNGGPVQIHFTDRAALTPAGTAVVGVCWNQTAPRVAPAIAKANETNNTQGNLIYDEPVATDTTVHVEFESGAVLLSKGQSIGIDFATASTSLVSCTIRGFFAIADEERT